MDIVVVTRHSALIEYMREIGLIAPDAQYEIFSHVTEEQIRDKVVYGVLPLHLAMHAKQVVEIPLQVPQELRGTELSLEQIREFAQPAVTYCVRDKAQYLQARAWAEANDAEVGTDILWFKHW